MNESLSSKYVVAVPWDSLILPDDLIFFARCHLGIENFTVCIILVENIYKCFAQNFGGKIISKVKIMKKYKYIDEISSSGLERREKKIVGIQVNLCQKLLFLHLLTHNMTTDCSWNYHRNYKRRT